MKFSRRTSLIINYVINDIFPPFLRDSKWFMLPLMKLAFKEGYKIFIDFREKAMTMSEEESRDD